uniref:Uncharacterized protein n=1 Tax=Cacopsylla melanoneura TaxID=428564 RepID=A0A8D9BT75_9HEMI
MDNRIPNFSAFVEYSSSFVEYSSANIESEPNNSNVNSSDNQQFQLPTRSSSQQNDCLSNTSNLFSVPIIKSITKLQEISQDNLYPIKTGCGDFVTATEGNESADTTFCINNQIHKTTQIFKFEDREHDRSISSFELKNYPTCTELQQARPMVPSPEEIFEGPYFYGPSTSYQQSYNNRNGRTVELPPNVPVKRQYSETQYQEPKPKYVERQNIYPQPHHGKDIPQEVKKYPQTFLLKEISSPNESNRMKSNTSRTSAKARPHEESQQPSKRRPSWTDWMSSMYESVAGVDDSQDTSQDSQEGSLLLNRESSRYKIRSSKPIKRGRSNGSHSSQDYLEQLLSENTPGPIFVFVKRAKIFVNEKKREDAQSQSRSSDSS